ncbi:MAG: NAD-dependent epimerase/dehydratase family protein [Gammaproteobacteria bacterium]
MAILVTGGTGFIGAAVVRELLSRGEHEVTVFHRSGATWRLDDVADQVRFIQGDLGNFSHLLDATKQCRPSAIYHFGAMLSVASDRDPAAAMQANVNGTFNVLEAARIMDVPQVLFASSIGTYGADLDRDQLDDLTLQRPLSFYGSAKLFGENMGNFYRQRYGLDFRGIRFPGVAGAGVRNPGMAQFHSWMVEESAFGRPFIADVAEHTRVPLVYVKDAAQGVVQLAAAPVEQLHKFNYLISGVPPTMTARELADLVRARVPGAQISFNPEPARQQLLEKMIKPIDDRFARQEWGWSPQYDGAAFVDDILLELKTHPGRFSNHYRGK